MAKIKEHILAVIDVLGIAWFSLCLYDACHVSLFDYWAEYNFVALSNLSMVLLFVMATLYRIILWHSKNANAFYVLSILAISLLFSCGGIVDFSKLEYLIIRLICFVFVAISCCRLFVAKFSVKNYNIDRFCRKYILKIAFVLLLTQAIHLLATYGIADLYSNIIVIIVMLLCLFYKKDCFAWAYYIYSTTIIGILITLFFYTSNISFYHYNFDGYYLIDDLISYSVINIIISSLCIITRCRAFRKLYYD